MTKCCFVIGPIGLRESDIRVAADHFIKYIVEPCTAELGFDETIRADRQPEQGRITTQVIKLLQSADLVIADLTDNNANVYYELSFRHAIGKPAIHVAVEGTDPLFDLLGERVIPYTMHVADVDRVKADLTAHIKTVLEKGYKQEPYSGRYRVITLEQSSEPTQQALAVLTREMQNLRGDVANLRSWVGSAFTATASAGKGLGTPPSGGMGLGLGFEQVSNTLFDPVNKLTVTTGLGRRPKSEDEGTDPPLPVSKDC